MRNRVLFALILMGLTSLAVQSLLIREFLVTFYGNEVTIGLILVSWIISEALGSGLTSRFAQKIAEIGTVLFLSLGLDIFYS